MSFLEIEFLVSKNKKKKKLHQLEAKFLEVGFLQLNDANRP
jgi:hypothetical protein